MRTSVSKHPEDRERIMATFREEGWRLIDFVAYMRGNERMSNEEVLAKAINLGFLDEEVQGCLLDLDFKDKLSDPSDFYLEVMLEISRIEKGGRP